MTIHAIYENGVFRPTQPVNLPDRSEVEVEIRQAKELVYDLTLVTHNTADFRNIPGLRLVDWLTP